MNKRLMRLAPVLAAIGLLLSGCAARSAAETLADIHLPETAAQTAETAEPTPETAPQTADTAAPTTAPTAEPTPEPTVEPTPEPTAEPTPEPVPAPAESCVRAQWPEEYFTNLSDYDRVRLGLDEEQPLVCFTTERTVTDFRVLSLTFVSIDENGSIAFSTEETHYQEALTPEVPLLVRMELMGTIPNNGISYVDADGATRYFAVEVSGFDGSLLLTEFSPQN